MESPTQRVNYQFQVSRELFAVMVRAIGICMNLYQKNQTMTNVVEHALSIGIEPIASDIDIYNSLNSSGDTRISLSVYPAFSDRFEHLRQSVSRLRNSPTSAKEIASLLCIAIIRQN